MPAGWTSSTAAADSRAGPCRRRLQALETELGILEREKAVGVDTAAREATAREKQADEQKRLAEIEARWQAEKALVDRVLAIRAELRAKR